MNYSINKQRGLSLIELMVAITLSMVLTLGVIQIFTSSKQTSRVQESLARLQENARFALDILSHDIRMAGQFGCNSGTNVNYASGLRNYNASIFGYEYDDLPADSALVNSKAKPDPDETVEDTDTIIILSGSTNIIPVNNGSGTIITVVNADDIDDIDAGDPLLLSDCTQANLTVVDSISGNAITVEDDIDWAYTDVAELVRLNYAAYYIRVDGNTGQQNLYRSYVNGVAGALDVNNPEPLLEGVEDFQILYGEDVGGGTIRYVDADTVGLDWSNVTSVRIYLLLSTLEDGLATEEQQYWHLNVNGCTESESNTIALCDPADDRRLYRSFTTTIQLRNQGIGI